LLYQGTLTLAAGGLDSVLAPGSDELLAMTAAGGLMILGLGIKLLGITDVRVGNYLPALVFAPLIAAISNAIG